MESLLTVQVEKYRKWVDQFAAEGFRILSLAIKKLDDNVNIQNVERSSLENNLEFVGFLVLENQLKKDSRNYVQRILESGRKFVILTGDHLLTSMKTF